MGLNLFLANHEGQEVFYQSSPPFSLSKGKQASLSVNPPHTGNVWKTFILKSQMKFSTAEVIVTVKAAVFRGIAFKANLTGIPGAMVHQSILVQILSLWGSHKTRGSVQHRIGNSHPEVFQKWNKELLLPPTILKIVLSWWGGDGRKEECLGRTSSPLCRTEIKKATTWYCRFIYTSKLPFRATE